MQPAIGSALRTALNPIARPACRFVGATRHPLSRRTFRHSAILYGAPGSQGDKDSGVDGATPENPKQTEGEVVGGDVASTSSSVVEADNSSAAGTARRATSRLKSNRPRNTDGLPPLTIPHWFLERNVKRVEDPARRGGLTVSGSEADMKKAAREAPNDPDADLYAAPVVEDAKYSMDVNVYNEILLTLKAGLTLRPPRTEKDIQRPVTILYCPNAEGTYYLDSVMETMSDKLGADLVRLDAQDIAQIVGSYIDENLAWSKSEISNLGYSAHSAMGKIDESFPSDFSENINDTKARHERTARLESIMKRFRDKTEQSDGERDSPGDEFPTIVSTQTGPPGRRISQLPFVRILGMETDATKSSKSGPQNWHTLKVSKALNALVGAADAKQTSSAELETTGNVSADTPTRDVIIQVEGYTGLSTVEAGPELLRALRSVVDKRWKAGRNIILVGTASTDDKCYSIGAIRELQYEEELDTRTIYVPPERKEDQDKALQSDERTRTRDINIRNIEDMVNKLNDSNPDSKLATYIQQILTDPDNQDVTNWDMDRWVWPYARVRRLATILLGLKPPASGIGGDTLFNAVTLLEKSDLAKFSWGSAQWQKDRAAADPATRDGESATADPDSEKVSKIRQKCNTYEKRLLSGVMIPSKIKTTFEDVHAPKETIDALKSLTSLSLLRPEAFTYGVLANDNIPGLLLYGPPGTGKTLLAKAVARESGAIMLEVSGAMINDMYIGEGEKNVKAVFTLAKKLSPCVVFIDEADALLATRGGGTKRSTSHRDIINQFLREWDGMSDHSAFIMVATNRPYDLDEAVLRRLPRRLLIDLPLFKDRALIFFMYVSKELLDPSVSLRELAHRTAFYSGSDIKNVCVAAAMACLREENQYAARAKIEGIPYTIPKRRTLFKRHFDKALDEISASITDDMDTLKAIRKFDEKYGDNKNRRKKSAALGFGGTTVEEPDAQSARVRSEERLM